mmetsp:Transcript_103813/g.310071  ORF Transcript_103813/g.310071 Transcript_103813/m.310071 type:complete len:123 (-) Transcript_103813:55-423(-)
MRFEDATYLMQRVTCASAMVLIGLEKVNKSVADQAGLFAIATLLLLLPRWNACSVFFTTLLAAAAIKRANNKALADFRWLPGIVAGLMIVTVAMQLVLTCLPEDADEDEEEKNTKKGKEKTK